MNRQNQCKEKVILETFTKIKVEGAIEKRGKSIQIRFSISYENSSKKQTQFNKIDKCIKDMMARHMYATNIFMGGTPLKI